MNDRIPERPLQPPHQLAGDAPTFDEHDDDLMRDICGKRLAKPVQELLLSLRDIKAVNRSFGEACLDRGKLLDILLPELEALREACVEEWRDL